MAIIITYDDSDGWYDHVMPPIVNQSSDPGQDRLLGATGLCGEAGANAYQDRGGYGPRLPLIVISPWARSNYIDHTLTDLGAAVYRGQLESRASGRSAVVRSEGEFAHWHVQFQFPLAPRLRLNPDTGRIVGDRPW